MAKTFPDLANYAFMDQTRGEKTREAYDDVGHYGTMAPYVILFYEGTAYHMDQSSPSSNALLNFTQNFKEAARY